MSGPYEVTLVNLSPDGRQVLDAAPRSSPSNMDGAALQSLLQAFTEVDELENAVSTPEIRVRSGNDSFLIRTEKKSLLLYDVVHQDRPALVLTVEKTMAEIDGSASIKRNATLPVPPPPEPELALTPVKRESPFTPARKSRLFALGALALGLGYGIVTLRPDRSVSLIPSAFQPTNAEKSSLLLPTLRGVYMTGYLPGHHGIVIAEPSEVKLFELRGKSAPKVVRATMTMGRLGDLTVLATDQPGGLIEVSGPDTLIYCGESYQRLR